MGNLDDYILKNEGSINRNTYLMLLEYITKEKKEQLLKLNQIEKGTSNLLGDFLARFAICNRTGLKIKDLVFYKNEFGKPLLLKPEGIHFNISHSGSWVVCAVSDHPVGIDVEIIKPISLKITYCVADEIKLINQLFSVV